jgi:hypothetical protein
MALVIKRKGYGQVEPNHLSGIVTGQIYAQLPTAYTKSGSTYSGITQLEQGQFAKYDMAAGKVNFTGDGEFMLVYNEEKLYDERKQSHKDFVYKISDFTDEQIYPRLIKTYVGDIMTTNTITVANTSDSAEVGTTSLSVGEYLTVGTNGFLTKATGTGMPTSGMVWKVVKEYTMPDGQPGVKIQRVQ